MDLSQWFQNQLRTSADAFLWGVDQVASERLYLAPRPNRWPIARIVYHLARYEERLALPSMLQWVGGEIPAVGTPEEDEREESREWNNGWGHEMQDLFAEFQSVRAQQIDLLARLTEQSWHEERDVIWGRLPLKWVLTKTYQHTLEHTDEVLRAVLWWRGA